jgi:hypothetical protein
MTIVYELGTYRGIQYHLSGRHGMDWSVQVHCDVPRLDDPIQVVRIDTSHGDPEIHRLYRRDEAVEPIDVAGFWDAVEHLCACWRRYAERHHANGHLPVPDGS